MLKARKKWQNPQGDFSNYWPYLKKILTILLL